MGHIIDSGRISTEARSESFYLLLPEDIRVYQNGQSGTPEIRYADLPHVVKALAELANYMTRKRIQPDDASPQRSAIVGSSVFHPDQNAHQFSLSGLVMEPEYEFVDGVIA